MADPSVAKIAPLKNRALRALLRERGACPESLTWLGKQDAETAWNACERADWMFWLLGRVVVDRRLIVRATVACAQPAVTAYVPAGELRPQAALDAALRWADDPTDANLAQAREARSAAAAYAADAAAYAYAYAAWACAAAAWACVYAAAADAAAYAVPPTEANPRGIEVRHRGPGEHADCPPNILLTCVVHRADVAFCWVDDADLDADLYNRWICDPCLSELAL